MNIAVIILSKNVGNLNACVPAVSQHEPKLRVVVVDDGIDWREFREGVEYVKGKTPFIYSRNCNIGIDWVLRDLKCEGVVLLNDDAILQTPGGFSLLAQATREHPEYGIIASTTNVTGQPLQFPRGIGLREVPHVAFVCVYIPRTTIQRVGMLDERYCLDYGCEDRDMCEAVRAAGLKVGVHDGCFTDHASLVSTFRGDPKAPKNFAKNHALLVAKWGRIAN